jgi:hypothetical protein
MTLGQLGFNNLSKNISEFQRYPSKGIESNRKRSGYYLSTKDFLISSSSFPDLPPKAVNGTETLSLMIPFF